MATIIKVYCAECDKEVDSVVTTFNKSNIEHELICGHTARTELTYGNHPLSDVLISTFNTY